MICQPLALLAGHTRMSHYAPSFMKARASRGGLLGAEGFIQSEAQGSLQAHCTGERVGVDSIVTSNIGIQHCLFIGAIESIDPRDPVEERRTFCSACLYSHHDTS